ncbi:MAG: Ldh family oxidoreductase [Candidatus Lokiarchaeota archaeon]|nr:Ldh family oxidoreductase [Candidatus Lokiarchaeota archaeon]MBD3339963.1 Ldh family oxidoreductase [Candidatus Lokiarchaeota archaeon]
MSDDVVNIDAKTLENFMRDVFIGLGVPKEDAEIIADVLIASDIRGIDTHGIQRCKMYYDRIKEGIYEVETKIEVIKDGPTTALWDGNCGMGHVIAYKAMKAAINKAKEYGLGAVAVRNSTHFGIAGYYSLMAIEEGMIGLVTTNARPSIPPTFGVEPMLGTNPLTFGAPTDEKFPFLLDCATSIIQRGKVELYERLNKKLPENTVINDEGEFMRDPEEVLKRMLERKAALLPLGGKGEETSGYKGYGYATIVELLSAALQNGIFLRDTLGIVENNQKRLKVGHFFLAINLESFVGIEQFKKTSGDIMRGLRSARMDPEAERIYTAGEKEYEIQLERSKKGIPLSNSLQNDIKIMKEELGLDQYSFNF